MIQANELRIGNMVDVTPNAYHYLKINKEPFVVKQILELSVSFESFYSLERYEDLQPIPLTEDGLKSLGFVFTDMADMGIHIGLKVNIEVSLNWHEGRIWIGEACTHIQFVHQLQNLYYALTGQELTLKS